MDDVYQLTDLGPISQPPSDYFCDYFFYYGSMSWFWHMPTASRSIIAVRFTVDPGLACTLYAGWAVTYGPAAVGTPDVRMYLYDDDGFGFPGNKLDSGTILNADLSYEYAYISVDWTNGPWVFEDGAEYHIGYTVLGGGEGASYPIISDDCDGVLEERSTVFSPDNQAWYTVLEYYEDCDYGWVIESYACCYEIPFSDCYSQSWDEGTAYLWAAPDPRPGYNMYDWAQRFTAMGKDTLASVDICVYNMGDTPPNVSGNDDLIIKVWDDDGTGFPGTVLATEIVPAGTYPFYPTYTSVDFYSHGLVFEGEDFFVSFNSSGIFPDDCEATLSDDETTPHGRSYFFWAADDVWHTIMSVFGIDPDLKYTANLCRDPYFDCSLNWYNLGPVYFWRLPDIYGDVANAQLIKAVGEDCMVKEVSWALYDNGDPDIYTYDSKVSVYSDAGGLPGTELASVILTPADYLMFPSNTTVDFEPQNVSVQGKYWIAIESFAPTPETGIRTMSDAGGGGWIDGAAELWGTDWGLLWQDWGMPWPDIAFVASSYHCCIPFDERDCGDPPGGEDWATHQHDQQRTGASFNMFGDAQCDLTELWSYTHPTNFILYTSPAISGDKIACAWDNQVKVFNLVDGTPVYTISGTPLGNQLRHPPTIHNGVMYLGGGDWESVSAWNFATGAMLWSRDITTVGVGGLFGETRYCSFILLDQGGTKVLYWGTEDGAIVAADAATGDLFDAAHPSGNGWATNPVFLGQSIRRSGATDDVSLFYCSFPGSVEGDVWSINAATGIINWQLSSSAGLQANTIFPPDPEDPDDPGQIGEGFPGGCSYENGVLYVNSDIATPWHPGDGVFYAINTADSTIKYAVGSMGGRGATGAPTPIIDAARIYVLGESGWVNTARGGRVLAFQKTNGALIWAYDSPEYNNYWGDAALTCEPEGVPDLLYVAGHHGFINCLSSDNGDEIYRRRVMHGGYPNSVGLSFAIAPGYIAMTDYFGALTVLAKGDDRPRLELQTYSPAVPVEFGMLTSLPTELPGVLVNTGCAPLTFGQFTTSLTNNHPWIPPDFASRRVREDVMDRAASITDLLTESFSTKALVMPNEPDFDEFYIARDRGETMLNAGATAGVPFLQYGTYVEAVISPQPLTTLPAGETLSVWIDVNQFEILRGPQDFYMTIPTDDPDFFLGGTTFGPPEIHVTIVGGCLTDTTLLYFGMDAANIHNVTNTGRIATGDDWMVPWGMDIDGDDASIFQGAFIWANGVYEQALNTQAWHGQGEEYSYWSHQADPNWCDDSCHAALEEDVELFCFNGYSEDGITYTPIMGNLVCKTYLDSMQDFSLGGSVAWDWENFGAPFDNDLTMGLWCESRTVGAVDFAPFKDLTIEIMEITERNGDSVLGWKMGATMDYDVGSDVADRDAEGSACWVSSGGTGDFAWGMMKFPFGCGSTEPIGGNNTNVDFEPIINAVTMWGYGAWWGDIYLGDTAWKYLNIGPGVFASDGASGGDEEAHFTIASHDWGGYETYELAVAQFGLHGITGGSSVEIVALGKLANKWVGAGRGDVNGDDVINLADIMYLVTYVNAPGSAPGPVPFMHLGDVDCDGDVDIDDVWYLIAWYFHDGPCPCFDWCF
ncbi:MAG: PQQ-binding-like beta-propeller repeat protein [candidate division Zixibacteria bacterium]|nr:PQQ-binding-like beta-propeller repeat protein [candidate division Zixibacteria bacterium]